MKIIQNRTLEITQREFWDMVGVDRLDLGTFLLHCPKQRPRPYTIASSPEAHPACIHLCASMATRSASTLDSAVALLQAKGVFSSSSKVPQRPDRWFGLCSQWMCSRLRTGDSVLAHAKTSVFKLAKDDE